MLDFIARIKGGLLQLHMPCLDFGEIQNISNHMQEMIRRAAQRMCQLSLFGREAFMVQQFRHSNHPIQRSANFMTHVGQECALGCRGGARFIQS
ncbi:MAG: hypothetical protein MK213_07040 [Planctomycetes bacterium]|nr:hypothetical protein [Planctomycetota bacterium]